MMPAIASKTESFSKRISYFFAKVIEVHLRALDLCTVWASLSEIPPRAPFRRIDGMVATHHRPSPRRRDMSRATSSRWCSQTSIFSLQMHRPSPPQGACAKHSRVARNGTSDIACRATITGQASHIDIENSTVQMMHHVEGYTDLKWPISMHAVVHRQRRYGDAARARRRES